jgi:hypothetical protein
MPCAIGWIVKQLQRTTGSRNTRGRIGGEPAVASLTLTVVGFVVVTALVIALARSSTARWERTKRAARAPRREGIVPHATLIGDVVELPGKVVRAATGRLVSLRTPVKKVAARLEAPAKQVVSRVRPLLRPLRILRSWLPGRRRRQATTGSSPASPIPDDATGRSLPLVSKRSRGPRAIRRNTRARAVGRTLFRRTPRLPTRAARRFLHRHAGTDDPHVLQAYNDESPTAR